MTASRTRFEAICLQWSRLSSIFHHAAPQLRLGFSDKKTSIPSFNEGGSNPIPAKIKIFLSHAKADDTNEASQFAALQDYFALIPVTFTDSRINRGAPTNGYVETRSYNVSSTEHAVELIRLVFDDASTVLPTGVVKEGTNDAWVDPTPARLAKIASLKSKIAALERKLKLFKKQGNKAKIAATTRSIRALKSQLARV